MRGTVPILTCDDESGCAEWLLDDYEMGVTNWRDFLDGWVYDPYTDRETAFCPEHKPEVPDAGSPAPTKREQHSHG